MAGYFAIECQRHQDRILEGLLIHHRQNAGHAQTDGADPAVGLFAKAQGTGAKHLALCTKVYVYLQSHYHLIF
jgi:hypothetical protein